jgi:hypothetical protein
MKSAGNFIAPEDKASILKKAQELRKQGLSANDAAMRAVDEQIGYVQGLLDSVGSAGTRVDAVKPEAKAPIGDFGQKIGGAKKDTWTGFKDDLGAVSDDEIAGRKLSEIWPNPDYQKMIDDGMDAKSVAVIRALRDEIPAKPRSPYKVKRWAEQVKTMRDLAANIMNGKDTGAAIVAQMDRGSSQMRGIAGRVDLYMAVGHDKSLEGIRLSKHHYSLYRGRENVTLWVAERDAGATAFSNWPQELATGDTKEQAIEAFREKYDSLDAMAAVKKAEFVIFTKGGGDKGFYIGKKIGRNIADMGGPFDSLKDARAYREKNLPELEAKLAKYKEIPKERRDTNEPRVGEDMRNGQDVTPEMFAEAFGFKGVEFGNYVEQKRRQKDLNDSFDALMDMAAIMGVPAKAISLNGELGLAFGARGSGGVNPAAAHYESDKIVINLTKREGAGSLGHEWWHALDNYFSRMRGNRTSRYMTTATDVDLSARGSNYVAYPGVRKEMVDAFGEVVRSIKMTAIKARSSKIDAKRTKEYWTTGEEMAARAFESYLISKLHDQNASNDYLANVVDQKTWDAMAALGMENEDSYPYPTAGEMPVIRAGFDKFFQTLETKETDKGVAMFSRATSEDSPGLQAFAKADELFALPLSEAKDLEQIARDNGEEVTVRTTDLVGEKLHTLIFSDGTEIRISDRKANPYGQDQQVYAFDLVDGTAVPTQIGRPGENPEDVPPTDDVWVDVSRNSPANLGAKAYNIAMTYALNNDKIFVGDPAGLTDMALRRRTEQMLSHALKSGTARHLAPHPRQVAGDAKLGVPPLKWIYGDHVGNIERMIDVSLESLENGSPGAKDDTTYDQSTGEFRGKDGQVVPRFTTMGRSRERYADGLGKAQAGWRTLARAAYLRSFRGPDGRAEGSGILDRAGADAARLANNQTTGAPYSAKERIFYSRGDGPARGITPAQFTEELSKAFGAKVADKLQAKGVVVPLADQSKLPKHVVPFLRDGDIIFGFFDPQTNKTYAVLKNLAPNMVKGLVLHEVGVHYGFENMLGAAKYANIVKRLDLMRKAGNKAVKAAHAEAVANAVNQYQVTEETIAYLVQNHPENGVVAEIIAKIKAFLFNNFGIGGNYLTAADIQMLARAAVDHASRDKDGGSLVPAFMRGTNGAMTNNDVVGNQGGRSADDTTPGGTNQRRADISAEIYRLKERYSSLAFNDPAKASLKERLNALRAEFASLTSNKPARPSDKALQAQYDTPDQVPINVRNWVRDNASLLTSDATDATRWNRIADTLDDDRYPSGDLTIYRAVADGDEIRAGDWVSTDRKYAEMHLSKYLNGKGEILEETVNGRDVLVSPTGNNEEAIYAPRSLSGPIANESAAPDSGGAFSRQQDQTDTPAFRKWFGDSKVVDADGKPLVVYHTTTYGDFNEFNKSEQRKGMAGYGFYFTDAESSSVYADYAFNFQAGRNWRGDEKKVNTMPVYLAMRTPLVVDNIAEVAAKYGKRDPGAFGQGREYAGLSASAMTAIQRDGFDGVIAKEYVKRMRDGSYKVVEPGSKGAIEHPVYAVFEPSQIKSATGNNGQFDGTNPDIRFSRASSPHSWDAPGQSKFDDLVYKLQDKQIDTKRVIEEIRNTGKALADEKDVYLQEELFHGRAAARTEDFVNNELSPLITEMKMRGIDIAALDEYLHARHAEEANALIADRNPDIQDGGSGMTTKAARDYLAKLDPAERKRLEAVAAKVDAILGKTRQMYADYNLESQATVNGWGQMFKNYVPLMREDKDGGMGIGQGFSIKGKETKGRTGSTRKVVDILANIAMQRERAIVRGEKNRVATALVGLVELNPNEDFWAVGPPPTEKVYDPKSNMVVDRADPLFKSRENVVVAKVKEPSGEVVEKAVRFNEDNERAVRMAVALKNLDAAQLNGLLGVSAKISRYFAAINTQYNPIFGVVNLVRDVQGAILNLTTTPLKDKKAEIAGHTLAALKGVYLDARAAREGKPQTSAWAKLWEDFQNEGGQTGYRDMFANSNDRAKAIEYELNPTKWMDSPLGKVFTANGTLKVPLEVAQKKAEGLFGWLSDYNLAMENAVRLSAYKVGLEQGMSKQQAASLAKNLTVNFNRKGQVGQQAGAVYAFFNASMQGSARLGKTLFDIDGSDPKTIRLSDTGKKIVYGGILLGVVQSLTLAAAGFDDEEPPEFVRERSLIIPTGGKTYITIPMPLGLHVLPNMGRIPTEFVLGGFKQPTKSVVKLLGLTAGAFNPIGGGASLTQMLAPTAVDPLVALAENKDWTGKPIAKTSYNKATPGFALTKDTASAPAKVLAEAINTMSGGTKYTAGVLSPTPDQIDYLWGQVTGGVGRELSKAQQSATAVVTGEDLPIHKIPLLGRFYGDADTQSAQSSKFYATINRLNEHEAEIKGMRKDRKAAELAEYMRDNPEARMFETANKVEMEVQKMRRMKREMMATGAPPERIKALEERITLTMTKFNERAAAFKKQREAEAAQ